MNYAFYTISEVDTYEGRGKLKHLMYLYPLLHFILLCRKLGYDASFVRNLNVHRTLYWNEDFYPNDVLDECIQVVFNSRPHMDCGYQYDHQDLLSFIVQDCVF